VVVSYKQADSARTAAEREAQEWADQHAHWRTSNSLRTEATPYWKARALSNERVNAIAEADPWEFWSAGAGQEAWAVNVTAGMPVQDVPTEAIPLLAMSISSFLGIELPDTELFFKELLPIASGALRPWRYELLHRCGDCAPPTTPLPPVHDLMSVTHLRVDPLGAPSTAIAVEREQRAVLASPIEGSPLTQMVTRVRSGGSPTPEEWQMRGVAGMAALELARAGRRDSVPVLLARAENAPSRTDRIACLWAARQLGANSSLIDRIEASL
jgi:hypothetical protein